MTLPFRLAHLLPFGIPHECMDIDVAERDIAHEFQSQHDHSGDPEEQNVEAGHERRSRIVGLEFRRLLRPSQRGEGPEAGRKPGVEHVRVVEPLLTRRIGGRRSAPIGQLSASRLGAGSCG